MHTLRVFFVPLHGTRRPRLRCWGLTPSACHEKPGQKEPTLKGPPPMKKNLPYGIGLSIIATLLPTAAWSGDFAVNGL